MSKSSEKNANRQELGWLAVGMLLFFLSSSAWALDLDQSIAANELDSAQVASTLGHGAHAGAVNAHTSAETARTVGVAMVRRGGHHPAIGAVAPHRHLRRRRV